MLFSARASRRRKKTWVNAAAGWIPGPLQLLRAGKDLRYEGGGVSYEPVRIFVCSSVGNLHRRIQSPSTKSRARKVKVSRSPPPSHTLCPLSRRGAELL